MRIAQRELYQQLRAEAIETNARVASLTRPLDGSRVHEHPEPTGWSVAEVLEHLCIADELYEAPLARLLASSRPDASAASREWKPTLIGGLIASSLAKPKPLKSPKVFQPGPTPRNGIVETFLAREQRFIAAMDDAMAYDWQALRIKSPALWGWMPKMNVGDGFRIHVVHLTRHSRQIERLAAKVA
jgi:hypothetical protein